MEKIVKTLREFKRELLSLEVDLKEGSSYQLRLYDDLVEKVDKLRMDLELDMKLEKDPRDKVTNEVAQAVEEVVISSGKSYSEVLEGAKQVYNREMGSIDKKQDFHNMFKGW